MKEIKFRAWDKTTNAMMDYAHIGSYGELYCARFHSSAYGKTCPDLILLQYTGIKDKNGKEIYAKDILKGLKSEQEKTNQWEVVDIVQHIPGGFKVFGEYMQQICMLEDKFYSLYWHERGSMHKEWYYEIKDIEVIGNIYENPDLLNAR